MPYAPEPKPFKRRPLRRDEGKMFEFGPESRYACCIIDLRYVGPADHPIHTVSFFDGEEQLLQLDADADGSDVHCHTKDVMVNHLTIALRREETPLEAGTRFALSDFGFSALMYAIDRNGVAAAASRHLAFLRQQVQLICEPYEGPGGVAKAAAELSTVAEPTTAQMAEALLAGDGDLLGR